MHLVDKKKKRPLATVLQYTSMYHIKYFHLQTFNRKYGRVYLRSEST